MSGNLSSFYREIPGRSIAYDYDNPGPPFSPGSIAAIDSIKDFLSASELVQARRLETVYYNTLLKDGCGTFIPGLRSYPTSLILYIGRFNGQYYADMLNAFLDAVNARTPERELDGHHWPWFRVTTPDGCRHYPLKLNEKLQAWKDRMSEVAEDVGTPLAWFDRGKFCLTDGRRFSFGDLVIDRLEGGKPIPKNW